MKQLFIIFIFALGFSFVNDLYAQKKENSEKKKTRRIMVGEAPSLDELKSLLEKRLGCVQFAACENWLIKELKCTRQEYNVCLQRSDGLSIKAHLNSSHRLKKVDLFDGRGGDTSKKVAEQVVFLNGGGKLLTSKNAGIVFDDNMTEEYEYLSIHIWKRRDLGSMPGGASIIWKD